MKAQPTPIAAREAIALPTVDQLDALPLVELAALGVELAALQVHVAMRLRRAPSVEPETLFTAEEVAQVLRISEDWVTHAKLPFRVKVGGAVRYSASGLARWQRTHLR